MDQNTIETSYSGAQTTVTDQVGRQRRSEVDGLGRLIKVTEMDSARQLNLNTDYSYDLLNNLTLINHGGQSRSFKYDSLSRVISKTRTIDSRSYTTLYEHNRGTR